MSRPGSSRTILKPYIVRGAPGEVAEPQPVPHLARARVVGRDEEVRPAALHRKLSAEQVALDESLGDGRVVAPVDEASRRRVP